MDTSEEKVAIGYLVKAPKREICRDLWQMKWLAEGEKELNVGYVLAQTKEDALSRFVSWFHDERPDAKLADVDCRHAGELLVNKVLRHMGTA